MSKYYGFQDKANVKIRKRIRAYKRWYNKNFHYYSDQAVPFVFLVCVVMGTALGIDSCQKSRANTRKDLVSQVTPFVDENNNNQLDPNEVMEIYRTLNKPYDRNYPNQDLEDYLAVTKSELTSTPK